MNYRDCFVAAVSHKTVTPMARDYSGSAQIDDMMKQALGASDYDQLLEKIGACIRRVGADFNRAHPACQKYHENLPPDIIPHSFGPWNRLGSPDSYGGEQHEQVYRLVGDITVQQIEAMIMPEPDWYDYNDLINRCNRYEGCARMLNAGSYMLLCTGLRAMNEVFMDMAINPEVADALFAKVHTLMKGFAEQGLKAAAGKIEIIRVGSDLGSQKGLLISRDMFRQYFFPRIREMSDIAHRYGAKLFFHSCGAVSELIPDLIEAGVDVLNPIQPVQGMEPERLKREFGRHLTFHGGVDTQQLMRKGTPAEVKKEVERITGILGRDGGYILSPSNNFMSGTPLENILAFYGMN